MFISGVFFSSCYSVIQRQFSGILPIPFKAFMHLLFFLILTKVCSKISYFESMVIPCTVKVQIILHPLHVSLYLYGSQN